MSDSLTDLILSRTPEDGVFHWQWRDAGAFAGSSAAPVG